MNYDEEEDIPFPDGPQGDIRDDGLLSVYDTRLLLIKHTNLLRVLKSDPSKHAKEGLIMEEIINILEDVIKQIG
jgi:hypothetical protein